MVMNVLLVIPKFGDVENTEAFVEGRKANNVLLFGDSGTGKSTSIKAIVNEYYDQGVRMIEIYKRQFKDLSNVVAQIKNRDYIFIIYRDDLSFEEFWIEYKFLKAVIEGGVETKPENILLYATSNRRHLIKETWNDRSDVENSNGMHRTDTMEETAYFLNLTVKSNKPVVLVGAMRPSTALSADGPLNLYNAVVTAGAKESIGKGVLIAMNGLILGAESAIKMNTIDVQTFQAPNSGALGYVLNGKVCYNQITLKKHTTQSVFDVTKLTSLPKVGIVYSYSNIEADMMTPLLNNGYKGIIHAGVGNGNIHKNIFPSLIDARRKGIVVVRSSRVPTGPTTLDAEVDDAKYQFVASQELNPQKSRVLLMLALTKTTDWKQIQEYFNEY